jgi:patatin-like phospholipase/acyl hydrolase
LQELSSLAFNILCLSGGGYLGLYTASVLAELEEAGERPILESFDLIAGTSIGGILALGLASGAPAASIRDTFINYGGRIFSGRPAPQTGIGRKADLLRNAGSAKYSAGPLKSAIEEIVGADRVLGDLKHRVMVPAVNLTKGRPTVFKTAHHPSFVRDWRLRVCDVALATSAAPTFFPVHTIGGEMFADGGVYANAPDQLALHEAEHFLAQPISDVRLLSIGTTTSRFSISNTTDPNMGWMAWMEGERLTSMMIASQQINADAMLRHRLGANYLRIDHDRSPEQDRYLGLDIATAATTADLRGLAESSVRDHLGNGSLGMFLSHRAESPTFYHRRQV